MLAAIGSGCGGSPEGEGVDEKYFGVNAQLVPIQLAQGDAAGATQQVEAIADTGVDFVRANADWVSLEPVPPSGAGRTYDFSQSDAWVGLLAKNGLRWQITGIGVATPEWNRDPEAQDECAERAPPTLDSFASLMGTLAGRYGSGGTFWEERPELPVYEVEAFEVWNEPNYGVFWCPAPDPEAYARMFTAAEAAIVQADPEATVVLGGLAGFFDPIPRSAGTALSVEEFIRRAIVSQPQLIESVDQVGLHLYGATPEEMSAALGRHRAQLSALGLNAPIAVNEVGWPTAGAGSVSVLPEEDRAEALRTVTGAIANLDCDVVAFAPHTWITRESDPSDPEDWFGIADPATGMAYTTATAYSEEVARLKDNAPDTLAPCPPP